jgi:hypothetical protein
LQYSSKSGQMWSRGFTKLRNASVQSNASSVSQFAVFHVPALPAVYLRSP